MDARRVIGFRGDIPWHYRQDMRHFSRITRGHAVIMGRATYDSMGKPLPKRRNIVVTRNRTLSLPGCDICHGLEEAIALARQHDPLPFVIGGTRLYRDALPLASHLYLTLVPGEHEGDTFFPDFDAAAFEEVERREGEEGLVWRTLLRRRSDRPATETS